MRDFQNGNPYYNAAGDLRNRYRESGGVQDYFIDRMKQSGNNGMTPDNDMYKQARQGLQGYNQFSNQGRYANPNFNRGVGHAQRMADRVTQDPVQPGPVGPPANLNDTARQFQNGNMYYNGAGDLRNRFAAAGGVNQFYSGQMRDARQAGDTEEAQRLQEARGAYHDWRNDPANAQYQGDACPHCGK